MLVLAVEEGSPGAHRLEDLSEDDFDGPDSGPDSGEEDEAAERLLLEQKQWEPAFNSTWTRFLLTHMQSQTVNVLAGTGWRRQRLRRSKGSP